MACFCGCETYEKNNEKFTQGGVWISRKRLKEIFAEGDISDIYRTI